MANTTSPLAQLLNQETLDGAPADIPATPIQGSGGGLADLVPAQVTDKEGAPAGQASLSEGEFVWPADIVSMIGDGSSDAGARRLKMFADHIRKMYQGKGDGKQAKGLTELLSQGNSSGKKKSK